MSLLPFCLESLNDVSGYVGSETLIFLQKYLNMSSEDEVDF